MMGTLADTTASHDEPRQGRATATARAPMTGAVGPDDRLHHALTALLGPRWSTDDEHRWAYARDASPLAVRDALAGRRAAVPIGVAWPQTTDEVAQVVRLAALHRVPVMPYGGGSGIVGGALVDRAVLVVDMKRMRRIRRIDPTSLLVTVEAGIIGSVLEEELVEHGLTTGHYPQSLHSSTVGGWIAHRGVGTFSSLYGRVEDLVLGLEVVLADSSVLSTRAVPASAAGPDLKRLFLGAEGTLGIVTAATMQVHHLAEAREPVAFTASSFPDALDFARRVVQAGYRPAVVRLYDAVETEDQFGALGLARTACLVFLLVEGTPTLVRTTVGETRRLAAVGGLAEIDGAPVADHWLRHRFSTAGLCRTLGTPLGVADALEVAADWSRIGATYERMRTAMLGAVGEGGRVYGHASHVYPSGANLYLIFHATAAHEEHVPDRYRAVLRAAMDACLASGGTITHHHGVGVLKAPWMTQELGTVGSRVLQSIKRALDPEASLNPGRLGL